MHEQPPIPREWRPVILCGDRHKFRVFRVRSLAEVESQQTQIARELSEVPIGDKARERSALEQFAGKFRRHCTHGKQVNGSVGK